MEEDHKYFWRTLNRRNHVWECLKFDQITVTWRNNLRKLYVWVTMKSMNIWCLASIYFNVAFLWNVYSKLSFESIVSNLQNSHCIIECQMQLWIRLIYIYIYTRWKSIVAHCLFSYHSQVSCAKTLSITA